MPELNCACESIRKLPLSTTLSPAFNPPGPDTSLRWCPHLHFARLENAVGLGDIHDLARAGIEHRRTRNHHRRPGGESQTWRSQTFPAAAACRIWDMHMNRHRARLRIRCWFYEIDVTVENFVGQRFSVISTFCPGRICGTCSS